MLLTVVCVREDLNLIRDTKSDRHLTKRASLLKAKDRTPAQLRSSIPSFPPSRRPLVSLAATPLPPVHKKNRVSLALVLGKRQPNYLYNGLGVTQIYDGLCGSGCRGMLRPHHHCTAASSWGVPYGSPNNIRLGSDHCHIPLCVGAIGPVLQYIKMDERA